MSEDAGDEAAGGVSTGAARWRLISLVPHDGREPPRALGTSLAASVWSAVTAAWHPAWLAECEALPSVEDVDRPSAPGPGEIRLVPAEARPRLPSGYETGAADAGTIVIEATPDRGATIAAIAERLGLAVPAADDQALDFLALGLLRWWLRDLTTAMGHVDCLDLVGLTRDTLDAARAWRQGDPAGVSSRLRAGFEALQRARERFYPVDAYITDICLLDPATPAGDVGAVIGQAVPISMLATAEAVGALRSQDPACHAAICAAIEEGRLDVAGGTDRETDEALEPLEAILWHFQRGAELYREVLDERTTETLARRHFGLYPQLPQIARRHGFRYGLHWGLDGGRYPVPAESKRLWESPDGSSLECLTRPPIAADDPTEALRLPWLIARTMKDHHVATLPLAHWPAPVAGWYADFRRSATHAPVMGRWVTLNDYFHLTDRPFESLRPDPDGYQAPYLAQQVQRGSDGPITERVGRAALWAGREAVSTLESIALALGMAPLPSPPEPALERRIEAGEPAAATAVEAARRALAEPLARLVAATAAPSRAGYLVINTLGVPRRAAVRLPEAAADLRPEGPLRVAQFTDEGVQAVVELPAFGYAWVPRDAQPERAPAELGRVSAAELTLRNETVEAVIDPATGGLRAVRVPGETFARLGQQLVIQGLTGPDSKPAATRMRAEAVEVEYGGPALAQAVSRGTLTDDLGERTLARFRQRVRLWSGRPTLELEIELDELDAVLTARMADAGTDPWATYLACRWAWPDTDAALERSLLLTRFATKLDRPETAEAIEIVARHRVTLLGGGLAHHQRHGARMLDTLLVTGREAARTFRLGIALDREHAFGVIQDFQCPPVVVPVDSGPPGPGPVGWFFNLDQRNVAVTRVEAMHPLEPGGASGLAFHLLETAGRATRCRLRLLKSPAAARQADFQGERIVDLIVEGDTVRVDLTPHELARVEVRLD